LSSVAEGPERASAGYRFIRGLLRIGFSRFSGTIRLLNLEALPSSGATILVVSYPAGWRDVLMMVAAFPRPLRCLVPEEVLPGWWRRGLARGLGMIGYAAGADTWASVTEACCESLGERELVVVFANAQTAGPDASARAVAGLALEAEARHSGRLGLSLFPIHLLAPQAGSQVTETLIHVDEPLLVRDYFSPDAGARARRSEALATELERRRREHSFCPRPEALARFVEDLEEALKADLEDGWSARPDWKQKAEGFHLSPFVSRWVEKTSYSRPDQVMALLETLDRCREERRQWALARLEVEAAGPWLRSRLRRAAAWAETAAGFPLAVYGLVNHFVIGLVLWGTGWFRRDAGADRATKWVAASLVTLAAYIVQILIVDKLAGRAAAGYYAPSLPLSAAYLWRYRWLLRHRTRLVLVSLRMPRQAALERRQRQAVIARFEQALRSSTGALVEKV
jgi:hypothetical protein